MSDNLLYYGDNLAVLRRHVKDESVDLVYLDPPLGSNQDYPGAPGLFAEKGGTRAAAQIKAFQDTSGWLGSSLRAPSTAGLNVVPDWGLADSTPGTRAASAPLSG